MRWTTLEHGAAPTLIAVLDPDDEVLTELTGLKTYHSIEVDEQCEVLSLLGGVALGVDGPQLHAHAVPGLSDGSTRGGHLLRGEVWPTLEVMFRETPAALGKRSRPDLGIAVIDI